MVEGGRFCIFQIRSKCWFSPPVRLMVADGGGEGKLAGGSGGGGNRWRVGTETQEGKIEGPEMREREELRRKK